MVKVPAIDRQTLRRAVAQKQTTLAMAARTRVALRHTTQATMAPERAQAKALEAVATRRQPSPAAVEDTPEAAIVTAVDTLAATVAGAVLPQATLCVGGQTVGGGMFCS